RDTNEWRDLPGLADQPAQEGAARIREHEHCSSVITIERKRQGRPSSIKLIAIHVFMLQLPKALHSRPFDGQHEQRRSVDTAYAAIQNPAPVLPQGLQHACGLRCQGHSKLSGAIVTLSYDRTNV